jgi:hypothetical protein
MDNHQYSNDVLNSTVKQKSLFGKIYDAAKGFTKAAALAGGVLLSSAIGYAQDKPIEFERRPVAESVSSKQSDDSIDYRVILKPEGFAAENFKRATANGKLVLGLGDGYGVDVTGQAGVQEQKFDNGTLEGEVARGQVGAFKYWDLGKDSALYTRVFAGPESREFTFKPETGEDSEFGNRNWNYGGQLGFVTAGDFADDETYFDDSYTKALFTFQGGKGDMTGEIDGDYEAWRATAVGQQYLFDSVLGQIFAKGGVGAQHESLGSGWENEVYSGELGVDAIGRHTRAGVYAMLRRLDSEYDGDQSSSTHPGVAAKVGWKPVDWLEVYGQAGYEWDDGKVEGLGANGLFGVKVDFGSRRKK